MHVNLTAGHAVFDLQGNPMKATVSGIVPAENEVLGGSGAAREAAAGGGAVGGDRRGGGGGVVEAGLIPSGATAVGIAMAKAEAESGGGYRASVA